MFRLVALVNLVAYLLCFPTASSYATGERPGDVPPKYYEIVEIGGDQSSLQVKPVPIGQPKLTLAVKSPEIKSLLKKFAPGDQIGGLKYNANVQPMELQDLSVRQFPPDDDSQTADNYHRFPRLLAFIVTSALLILLSWLLLAIKLPDLIKGADNRYSNSKTQIVVWFFVLMVSYIVTLWLRWRYMGSDFFDGINIPQNLLLLSGLSAITFAAAKGITQSKVDAALQRGVEIKKADNNPRFPYDLFHDDEGRVDMSDFQMIVITLLAVVVYVVRVFSFLGTLEYHRSVSLPDIDTTILSTFGLGQGAYLVKKLISDVGGGAPAPPAPPAAPMVPDTPK